MVPQINGQIDNVIHWNAVARMGEHDFSQEAIAKQCDYTIEEIEETIKALIENNLVETLDGLADIFVTASYLAYVVGNIRGYQKQDLLPSTDRSNMLVTLALMHAEVSLCKDNPSKVDTARILYDVIDLLVSFCEDKEVDPVALIKEVMDSNWSKFPEASTVNIENEAAIIPGNVAGIVTSDNRVVFRDGNGQGKIKKPSVFREPNIAKLIPSL
jgi:hypothetical protein